MPDIAKPVIPETITVHLGTPDSDAQNVTLSFPDYIKNVASSEIYPTWPEAAIRANIYAQVTFALNRVYTEWYRSRGYDFDITSSTRRSYTAGTFSITSARSSMRYSTTTSCGRGASSRCSHSSATVPPLPARGFPSGAPWNSPTGVSRRMKCCNTTTATIST